MNDCLLFTGDTTRNLIKLRMLRKIYDLRIFPPQAWGGLGLGLGLKGFENNLVQLPLYPMSLT